MRALSFDPKLRNQVAAHFSEAFRLIGRSGGSEFHAEGKGWHRIHTRLPHLLANMGIVDSGDDLPAIQAAVPPLVSPNHSASVVFQSSDVSPPARAFLHGNGFELLGGMPLMAIPIGRLPETGLPEGVQYVRVAKRGAAEWGKAMAAGYGLPLQMGAICAALIGQSGVQAYAAVHEGEIVGTSMCFLHDGLAGIYCVATLPRARGKGIGSHLTAEPLREAAAIGYAMGILQSSERGYSVYQKLGFEVVGAVPIYGRLVGPAHGPS